MTGCCMIRTSQKNIDFLKACGWRSTRTTPSRRGGRGRVDDRAVFTAIVFVLASGCAWRNLPPSFGVAVPTAHRRFSQWTQAGLWRRLHRVVLDELGSQGKIDWSRAVLDAASVRAKKGAA